MSGMLAFTVVTDPLPVDPTPNDNDVVAGWTAAVVFALLIAAVVVLSRSLVTRLRNVDRAADEGKYDPSSPQRQARERRGLGAPRPPSA